MTRIERTIELDAPVWRVWRALTDPERSSAWLGGDVSIEARPAGPVSWADEDGVRRGTVEAIEEERHLSLRLWSPPGSEGRARGTRVEFTLEDLGGGTRLTVTESSLGVAGLHGPNAEAGLHGPNAEAGLRGPNAEAGLRGPNAVARHG
jgi:uncharacterized protein YndB with AHSA1/START domain